MVGVIEARSLPPQVTPDEINAVWGGRVVKKPIEVRSVASHYTVWV